MVPPHPPTLFDFLNTEAGAALRSKFHERTFVTGNRLLKEEAADHVFLVKTGRWRVYLAHPERELTLSYLNPGDVFSTHTRAELQAVRPSVLLLAPRRVIERHLEESPPLQVAILRALANVLNQTITLLEDLAFHQVRGRISRYLLRCADRQKVAVEPGNLIHLDLTIEELAALLGTTRQTASTELNAMIHASAIARPDRRQIRFCSPATLREWAAEDTSVSHLTDKGMDEH